MYIACCAACDRVLAFAPGRLEGSSLFCPSSAHPKEASLPNRFARVGLDFGPDATAALDARPETTGADLAAAHGMLEAEECSAPELSRHRRSLLENDAPPDADELRAMEEARRYLAGGLERDAAADDRGAP